MRMNRNKHAYTWCFIFQSVTECDLYALMKGCLGKTRVFQFRYGFRCAKHE
jgi:hypothetical protein